MNGNLIEFSVGNYKSFKEINTLSMLAANIKTRDGVLDKNNTIIENNDITLISSAAIYGANASGKSNLVSAMSFMRYFVLTSSKNTQFLNKIKVFNFKLSEETENSPSYFQIVFLLNGTRFRYGFEINRNLVVSEWLFFVPSIREAKLFVRDENGIELSKRFKEGRGIESKTRSNALFLSVVAQFNGEISMQLMNWFKNFKIISGLEDKGYKSFSISNFESGKYRDEMINLVKKLDLGINDIDSKRLDDTNFSFYLPNEMPEDLKKRALKEIEDERVFIQTTHQKYDKFGKPKETIQFNLQQEESEGTKKLFYFSAPIIDALTNGYVLVIDEIEARLHPLITLSIVKLFNSKESNPNGGQLIFTTHDTNLLSKDIFRRDQVWFTEKDGQGESHLYSLADLKVRNDASFENDYIHGRYGAIPFISHSVRILCES